MIPPAGGSPLVLRSPRLELFAAGAESARLQLFDRQGLARWLDARVPGEWPHESMVEALEHCARDLIRDPLLTGWFHWHFVSVEGKTRTLIGDGGFKGPPDAEGKVEVGYAVLAPFQGRGYASQAVGMLVEWAFADPRVKRIGAETYVDHPASLRVLEKNGFLRRRSAEGLVWLERTPEHP